MTWRLHLNTARRVYKIPARSGAKETAWDEDGIITAVFSPQENVGIRPNGLVLLRTED
jgi:hypothetical protein